MTIEHFVGDIEGSLKTVSEEVFEVKQNVGYQTVYFHGTPVIRLRQMRKASRVEVPARFADVFGVAGQMKYTKSDPNWGSAELDAVAPQLIANAPAVCQQCYLDGPMARFDCCSRYVECSDHKRCIHPDQKFARGCTYRRHLDQGRVFYGGNRNVG